MDYQVMPELSDDEYERLKQDIAENGCTNPVDVDEEGNILDGHHRVMICDELGIEYDVREHYEMSEQEKLEFALRMNINRRQLSGEQLDEVIHNFKADHPNYSARRIASIIGVDHHTVVSATDRCPRGENPHVDTVEGTDGKSYPATAAEAEAKRTAVCEAIAAHPEKSDRQISRETGSSPTTVGAQRKKMITVNNPSDRELEALRDPDIRRRMAENEGMTVAKAIREQKRDKHIEHLESVEVREAKEIDGVYDVIEIDPPWPMKKIEMDVRPNQCEFDYPTMTIDQIKSMDIPAADDCHLFLWTTQKFLPEAFEILKSWGMRYVVTFVWHKTNGGYKPIDLPIYNCEFCIYARKGKPRFVDDHDFKTCFETPITEHSAKPEEFYNMLRRVTAGRRLSMFARRSIEGFETWGNESPDN